jgi:outer membrane protein W
VFARTLLFTISVALLVAATAVAQIGPGDGLLTLNGGYVTASSAATDQTIDGGMMSLTFEKLDWANPVSLAFNIGYATASGDSGAGTSRVETSTNSVPVYVGGKYWLGKSKIQGYLGAAIGVYFTWLDRQNVATGESFSSVEKTGFGLGVPIGGTFSIGETVFINANYTLNWLWENELLKNDLLHSFNLGLGYKFGT